MYIRIYVYTYVCMHVCLSFSLFLSLAESARTTRSIYNCVCVCVCVFVCVCVSAEEQIMTWEEIGGPPPPSPSGLQPLSAYEARPYDAIAAGHIQV